MNVTMAVIGTSSIVERFVESAKPVDDLQVTTVFSRDDARAASTADRLGIARSTSDWLGLMADTSIDAIYVATPNSVHAEQARAALLAGKHVLVEKPATPTAQVWQDLVELARSRDVVLLEEMRPAHDPGTAEIARLLPVLGQLRRVSFDYTKRSDRYDQVLAGGRPGIFDPDLAGGALNDLGIYAISQLVQLMGEPDRIWAADTTIATQADGSGVALASYDAAADRVGGLVADLSWSKITGSTRESEIQGELATLTIDHIADPRRLVLTGIDGHTRTIVVDKPADNMTLAITHFVECVLGRAAAGPDQERTAASLRTLERIRVNASGVSSPMVGSHATGEN